MLILHYCTSYNGLLLYLLYFFSSRLTHDELINKELKCACLVFSYYWGGERAVWRLTALQGPLTKWVLTDGLDTTYHDLLIARPHSSAKCRQNSAGFGPKQTKTSPVNARRRAQEVRGWAWAVKSDWEAARLSCQISVGILAVNVAILRDRITEPSLTFPDIPLSSLMAASVLWCIC